MNGFIPILVAVLLSEFGLRNPIALNARASMVIWGGMAALLLAAAAAGQAIAQPMTDWAGALLIAVALALAATGQFLAAKPRASVTGQLWAFWSGGAPLLAFAFGTRFGLWAAGLGALGGLIAAAIMTWMATQNAFPLRSLRATAAALLLTTAAIVVVGALRLVETAQTNGSASLRVAVRLADYGPRR